MPPHPRQPSVRSVRTPPALTALRAWLGTFPAEKREEGGEYYRRKAVKEVWSEADHLVKAELDLGGEVLAITLFLTRGAWTSRCSCPVLHQCEHVYAASLAWLAAVESGQLDGRRPSIPLLPAERSADAKPAVPAAPLGETVLSPGLSAWLRALPAPGEQAAAASAGALHAVAGLRVRLDAHGKWHLEIRVSDEPRWKPPAKRLLADLAASRPADFEHLPAAEAALGAAFAAECRLDARTLTPRLSLSEETVIGLLRTTAARAALVLPDGTPFTVQTDPLAFQASASPGQADRLDLHLVTPDGRVATGARLITPRPEPLYLFDGRVWRGPPPVPASHLPTAALNDVRLLPRLRAAGIRLPAGLSAEIRTVVLRPRLRCWLTPAFEENERDFHAQLVARAENPPCEQRWTENAGWQWSPQGLPPPRGPEEPLLEFDLTAASAVSGSFASFRLVWDGWAEAWTRPVSDSFPDEFISWHDALPDHVELDVSPELADLLGAPVRGHLSVSVATAGDSEQDWFDLSVGIGVQDTTLTPEEIALLLKARGKWVTLPKHGWRRLDPAIALDPDSASALERLGLSVDDVMATGRATSHRLHALQLAAEAAPLVGTDSLLVHHLRDRAARLAALPAPTLPAGLRAELRPYQREGFLFLAHLSAHGLGGVLADDMGLGKTVQTLAWLLHLAETRPAGAPPFRCLVVCPKSVTHGWLTEAARFAPGLAIAAFDPVSPRAITDAINAPHQTAPRILVANYTQLRLHATAFRAAPWDAVVLDEGQFIKNPGSQVAVVARALRARHRVVLTGTPIENRLTDLWSLFAFAQPGLLGDQPAFRRQYPEVEPEALARLHRRVQHFLLRRTKAQAAPDLPTRTEDDIIVDLEGEQRRLYDAELKRARAHLMGVKTPGELGAVRFHVLASLLRLRQICCHPALVDPAHAILPSAKLDALLERVEELADEGHQVLVFSQFVGMLEIIRTRLTAANIGHLILTGATENRAELVDQFQTDRTKTVFLLSLKAAGFGLNLTAASYAFLYDPWWNPAAEAQAIDRIHRIGQTRPVMAYRLIADNTVEQKIRALQREKSALASAVIQEESVATVMDLDSLREILS
ncbi:ATP-dependent helicase HepA [Lacunisphaera limnophila]|uniref:ATP-dependent helicase HepA n=1 Tax=Lacunisphaera limnophila TaxID=1838286 RepID=A0A1D8AT85_9BACT|nr:DEAD/DEAH box helicase [Lacunisphaera limnophila]AOS44109.1 ATP-dependent helicase HepA [Lacunisphaera limnophila]